MKRRSRDPQPPQASASTNSAIRAGYQIADEECPETRAVSSNAADDFGGQVDDVDVSFPEDSAGNKIFRCGVYFVANHDLTMVKIGKSQDVDGRVSELMRMNGSPIQLLADVRGYTAVEKFFHRRFAEERRHGEWFEMSERVRNCISIAAANRSMTATLCPRELRLDEAPPDPPTPPLPWDHDFDPVGDELDILQRWRAAKGVEVAPTIELNWEDLSIWDQGRLQYALGAWVDTDGTVAHSPYAAVGPVAHVLALTENPDDRTLALIVAALRDADNRHQLRGPHRHLKSINWMRLGYPGNAKHFLPIGVHSCNECRLWYDRTAVSTGEFLRRLAHLTVLDAQLGRILNHPHERQLLRYFKEVA